MDLTYSAALLEYFTVLESQLGIVLACLPIARPAAIKISKSAAMTMSRRLISAGSKSTSGAQGTPSSTALSSDAKKKDFHRLHDNVDSFSDARETVNGIESLALQDLEGQDTPHIDKNTPSNAIKITRTWENHSS